MGTTEWVKLEAKWYEQANGCCSRVQPALLVHFVFVCAAAHPLVWGGLHWLSGCPCRFTAIMLHHIGDILLSAQQTPQKRVPAGPRLWISRSHRTCVPERDIAEPLVRPEPPG
jgi:hypothetical protein